MIVHDAVPSLQLQMVALKHTAMCWNVQSNSVAVVVLAAQMRRSLDHIISSTRRATWINSSIIMIELLFSSS